MIGKIQSLDFSFVDYVSRSLATLIYAENLSNQTYHIYNKNLVSMTDFAHYLSVYNYNVECVDVSTFLDFIVEKYNDKKISKYIEKLILHMRLWSYIEETYFTLISEKTDFVLSKLGFSWPEVSEEKIRMMLSHCEKVKFLGDFENL